MCSRFLQLSMDNYWDPGRLPSCYSTFFSGMKFPLNICVISNSYGNLESFKDLAHLAGSEVGWLEPLPAIEDKKDELDRESQLY